MTKPVAGRMPPTGAVETAVVPGDAGMIALAFPAKDPSIHSESS